MAFALQKEEVVIQRVRAILLTERNTLLFIKRVKPNKPPYWVAPGGGVEDHDASLLDTLDRELCEELGAVATVLKTAFVLEHEKAGKNLQEFFFICRLITFDLGNRHGPEFADPSRGLFLVDEIPLDEDAIMHLNMPTEELQYWLVDHLPALRALCA